MTIGDQISTAVARLNVMGGRPPDAWISVGAAFKLMRHELPPGVDPRDMVHATRGEIHLTSDCGPTCPSVER